MSLKDKSIVVTGGSRGLGLGLVEALVDRRQSNGRCARRRGARRCQGPARRRHNRRRRRGRDRSKAYHCRSPPGHSCAQRRRQATDGSVGSGELGGFHHDLGHRRQGWALLAAGGTQPAAQAGKSRPRWVERCGRERIADVGRLCGRQTHALDHGQICRTASPRRRAWASTSRQSCRCR